MLFFFWGGGGQKPNIVGEFKRSKEKPLTLGRFTDIFWPRFTVQPGNMDQVGMP